MKIDSADLKIIPDSRGDETLRAELTSNHLLVRAEAPNGKSRGTHEVLVLNPQKAVSGFGSIQSRILDKDFEDQTSFDNFLIELDGTPNKAKLGGNLILVLSLAWARLKAASEKVELYEYIAGLYGKRTTRGTAFMPWPLFNVIEGGVHTKNNLDFQEFQVIPQEKNFRRALEISKEFYARLKAFLSGKYKEKSIKLGDEAGFSAPFKNNEEALEILINLIQDNDYNLRIGLDIAANQLFEDGRYAISGKKYSSSELISFYLEISDKYNILSIEDPFTEESFNQFSRFKLSLAQNKRETLIITDDLTTTNPERLKLAIERNTGDAVVIKPNQIGTLSETIEVAKIADAAHWKKIVSHRSGETNDDFIADLAVGIEAWGIKAGAPAKPERLAKYKRLLEISSRF